MKKYHLSFIPFRNSMPLKLHPLYKLIICNLKYLLIIMVITLELKHLLVTATLGKGSEYGFHSYPETHGFNLTQTCHNNINIKEELKKIIIKVIKVTPPPKKDCHFYYQAF